MDGCQERWSWARTQARRFLGRFTDTATRQSIDDLTQEAVTLAWQWSERAQDPSRLGSAVVTIVRRKRFRALQEATRTGSLLVPADGAIEDVEAPGEGDGVLLGIDGRAVPLTWALQRLPLALSCLSTLDRQLLLGFHEGFCCAELAHRFGKTEDCVKTRIHRARRRVRDEFECIVRVADDLDG